MRALIDDPTAISERQYQRFLRRAQVRALMADHLVAGEPYPALNALVVTRRDHEALADAVVPLSRAFVKAGRVVARDPATVVAMGFPWMAAELLAAETAMLPLLSRFDFVVDGNGRWWVLELNADTPSGVREAIGMDPLVAELRPEASPLAQPSAALGKLLTQAFVDRVGQQTTPSRLGLVTTAGELEDLAQMAFTQGLIEEPLRKRGVEVLLGDADNLGFKAGRTTLLGRPIDHLYRYVPLEAMLGHESFVTLYEAVVSGRLRLLNGLFGLLLQCKGLLAWIWERRRSSLFTAGERDALERYLTPTWHAGSHGVPAAKEGLVAKHAFGREGAEVLFGDSVDDATWRALPELGAYVIQPRIEVQEFAAGVFTSGGPMVWQGRATVGAFAVVGRFGGYYSRFGGRVITNRAKWMATYVEAD
ncbi:MAG: glutathionylspermidine synthase family protein [Chloroflexota bacterium]